MKYTVQTAVEHDGKRYEEGDQLDLDAEQAEPLLRVRAIGAPAKKGKAEEGDA